MTIVQSETSEPVLIRNIFLAYEDHSKASKQYDVALREGRVLSIHESAEIKRDQPSLLIPSLTHSHVHLDKCFIMDRTTLIRGDFEEALATTAKAKANFVAEVSDLLKRGERLVRESVQCGVTSIRAHVEVDGTVEEACLNVALTLKESFKNLCDIQIAVFAQDPLFNSDGSMNHNHRFFVEACGRAGVSVVGSAPYVEKTSELAKANIACVLDLAQKHNLLVDFHLDYNLNTSTTPLVHEVIDRLKEYSIQPPSGLAPAVTIGHATRLSLMSSNEWRNLHDSIRDLPIYFVGLPQSDLYMMGRNPSDSVLTPRGTLNILRLKKDHDIRASMSINNVQNAFTPQGSVDPLSLCPLGVAIFQSATPDDCRTLLESVTIIAKCAIGEADVPSSLAPKVGDRADFVILHGRYSVEEAVLNPPFGRTTIKGGEIVSRRNADLWMVPHN